MKKQILANVRRLQNDSRGAISILFGLSIVIFVLLIGGAIDFGLSLVSRSNLQTSGDTAALSGAIIPKGVKAETVARRYFDINYHSNSIVPVSFDDTDHTFNDKVSTVTTSSRMPTTFLAAGKSENRVSVGATSEVNTSNATSDFDLVLALDESGSMLFAPGGPFRQSGDPAKIEGLRNASRALVDILLSPEFANNRLGMVGWATTTKGDQVFPLNASKQRAINMVDSIYALASGVTCGECGMKDAIRLLSDTGAESPRLDGESYSENKRIVFMTDGILNQTTTSPNAGGNDTNAYPAWLAQCSIAKSKGINVTVIGFDINATGSNAESMRSCASTDPNGEPQIYYAPSNVELGNIFRGLAVTTKSLRLTK